MAPFMLLWGKADRTTGAVHPLIYHLIEVGQCARALWEQGLAPATRAQIAKALAIEEAACGQLLAFWAALHDLGKANPAFQAMHAAQAGILRARGFDFPASHGAKPTHHGLISTWALKTLLQKHGGMSRGDARRVAHAIGGHHGIWPNTASVQDVRPHDHGDGAWDMARRALFFEVEQVFQPPHDVSLPQDTAEANAVLTLLSGLTTAADWLGSAEEFFAYEEGCQSPQAYARLAAERAEAALRQTGWTGGWQPEGEVRPFEDLFPFICNAIQEATIREAQQISAPALLILEAPTGVGKTEAALYLADAWLQLERGRGLYVAMPTRATSNQMFARTAQFLHHRYPGEHINIHLAHAQASWDRAAQALNLESVGEAAEDLLRAEAWFLPRKRTLLAPFGVGTVDQALMGVLQTRHFFLRLFGLAHKVIIFDEVHAYDTYMEKLFLRLLTWLRAVGTSVVVLSATLPEATRRNMVAAFTGIPANDTPPAAYPRLTIAGPHGVTATALPASAERLIRLGWVDRAPETIAAELGSRLEHGGCAAVVCNTVRRAQEVYQALATADFPAEQCLLFHARFPAAWREAVERQVLGRFGKRGQRPKRAVLVATQVVEQSLDLDFDLMISDLAPIDLLIQRAGRLHRHPDRSRPPALQAPLLLLTPPEGSMSDPNFSEDGFVYQPYILWQSWRALDALSELRLPAQTSGIIEFVYGALDAESLPAELADGLRRAHEKMVTDFQQAAFEAGLRLVPEPQEERLLTDAWQDLQDDENPALHPQVRALTRLADPGITLVCLHRLSDGSLNLEPDGSGLAVNLDVEPGRNVVRALLRYTVSTSHPALVRHFADRLPWRAWARSPALRYAYPLVFESGLCPIEGTNWTTLLDQTLGLRVEREESR
ncbi:MAG: CRISPR-associated helicase Cas3' [Chloroflexota bacterium]